jgi:type IV pilus assembly protein PilV
VATSKGNNRGFTLVEVMVAILIMMVGLLGLLTSVNVASEHNLKNHLRNEAVQIAGTAMSAQRIRHFDNLDAGVSSVPSLIRGGTKNYTVTRSINNLSADSKEIIVEVDWTYKDVSFHHETHSIRSR